MPDTCPSSSTDPKPPCCWRYSTIFWTVAGPTPGNVSSCSGVAVLRLTGAAGGGPRRAHRDGTGRRRSCATGPAAAGWTASALGHHDLAPVLKLGGEVDAR